MSNYSKERIDAKFLNKSNYVGVDSLLQNKQGKTDSTCVPKSGKWIKYEKGNVLLGNIRPYLRKIWFANIDGGTNGDVLVIQPNDIVFSKYLYYILSSDRFFEYDNSYSKGAKMPRGDKNAIMNYEFMLPTLQEQERIVNILDKYDKLCNDIKEGLPAEIEKRQRQYEYYRDKLLSFKES